MARRDPARRATPSCRAFTVGAVLTATAALLLVGCPKPQPKAGTAAPGTGSAKGTASAKTTKKTEPDPWAGRDAELIKRPSVKSPEPLKLPALTRAKLRNGLAVLAVPDRSLPLISVQLVMPSGSIDDPKDKIGLADFVSMMLRQGVRGMSADRISRKVDAAAVSLGAGSGYEMTTVSCRGRRKQIRLCLEMISRLVRSPTFPKKEMREVRNKLKASVKSSLDNPGTLASLHFANRLYGDEHPGGQPMTMATIEAIKRKHLVRFHRKHFVPGGAVLAISGDFDAKKILRQVKRRFGRWRGKRAAPRKLTPVGDTKGPFKVLLVDKPDLTQSYFSLGHAGVKLSHPDREAIMAMNYTLGGGGFSSRLMKVVRSKGGKTYGIRSGYSFHSDDGHFEVKSFTRNAEIVRTLALVRSELSRIASKAPPSAAELAAAQGKIAGGFAIGFPSGAHVAAALARAQIRGLPETYVTRFAVRIAALKAETVAKAARAHVRPAALTAVIVGRASVVAPLLRKAKIPFEKVSFLAPVSAAERAARAAAAKAPITKKQLAAARKVLGRALKLVGGRKRVSAIKTLRQAGTVKMGPMTGVYIAVLAPPERFKIAFSQGPLKMELVLRKGRVGFASVSGSKRKRLPKAKVNELLTELWRKPPFVLVNALAKGVRQRIVKVAGVPNGGVAVEVRPPELPPTTLVFNKRRRLERVMYRDARGGQKVIAYAGYKKVKGVSLPHKLTVTSARRPQAIHYGRIEINPKLPPGTFK